MKKILLCTICFMLCYALCSCSVNSDEEESKNAMTQTDAIQVKKQTQAEEISSEVMSEKITSDDSSLSSSSNSNEQNEGVTVSQELIIEEGSPNTAENVKDIVIKNTTELRSFLDSLDYHSYTSDGLPEYKILFDDGSTYYVNLSSQWVWKGNDKEATLSQDLLSELQTLLGIES